MIGGGGGVVGVGVSVSVGVGVGVGIGGGGDEGGGGGGFGVGLSFDLFSHVHLRHAVWGIYRELVHIVRLSIDTEQRMTGSPAEEVTLARALHTLTLLRSFCFCQRRAAHSLRARSS